MRRTHTQAAKNVRGVGYTLIYMSSKYELGPLCSRSKAMYIKELDEIGIKFHDLSYEFLRRKW